MFVCLDVVDGHFYEDNLPDNLINLAIGLQMEHLK